MLLVTNSRIYSINCKNWLCPWELITAFDALGIIYLRGTIYRQTLILFYVRASWFIGPSLPLQVVSPWTEFNNHYVLRVWKFVLFICLCECVYLSIFQPCDEIISTFCCKGITLGFFLPFCECFEYQMSYQEMNDIFYLSTKSSTCFVKMLRM